jgi:hypothetical protein
MIVHRLFSACIVFRAYVAWFVCGLFCVCVIVACFVCLLAVGLFVCCFSGLFTVEALTKDRHSVDHNKTFVVCVLFCCVGLFRCYVGVVVVFVFAVVCCWLYVTILLLVVVVLGVVRVFARSPRGGIGCQRGAPDLLSSRPFSAGQLLAHIVHCWFLGALSLRPHSVFVFIRDPG